MRCCANVDTSSSVLGGRRVPHPLPGISHRKSLTLFLYNHCISGKSFAFLYRHRLQQVQPQNMASLRLKRKACMCWAFWVFSMLLAVLIPKTSNHTPKLFSRLSRVGLKLTVTALKNTMSPVSMFFTSSLFPAWSPLELGKCQTWGNVDKSPSPLAQAQSSVRHRSTLWWAS